MNNDNVKKAQRIARTVEYRGKNQMEKAIKLVNEEDIPVQIAAKATGVDRFALSRALKSKEEGREVGSVGRPRVLTQEEEDKLVSIVKEKIKNKTPLTYKQFKTMVCAHLALFSLPFSQYLSTQHPIIICLFFPFSVEMYT